jgi:hypothetical protein
VDYGEAKVHVPLSWGYYQYLMLGFFPNVIGRDYLMNSDGSAVISRLYMQHMRKNINSNSQSPYRLINADIYLLTLAADLETLYLTNNANESILRRLRSKHNTEMRGVIYEMSLASGFARAGYKIN